jgi:hypothetical protein
MKSEMAFGRHFMSPAHSVRFWDADALEYELAANQPFSNPVYLLNCTVRRYAERLKMLVPRLPVAAEAEAALMQAPPSCQHRILGDPVMRAAINQALASVSFGEGSSLQEMGEIIEMAAFLLRSDSVTPVLQIGSRTPDFVSFFGRQIWFWQSEHEDDLALRLFNSIYERQEGSKSVLVSQLPWEREQIIRAINLLIEVFPRLTESVLHHVNLICLCDAPADGGLHFTSFTTIIAPGTLFIARSQVSSTWLLAEAILHEALHTKLYDFQHTHSLFMPKDLEMTNPIVCALWNRPAEEGENQWPLNRSLFALHVYVHLAIYFCALARNAVKLETTFGPCDYADLNVCMRRAFDRAHHLELHIAKCGNRLGAAGQALLLWLTDLLRDTDPAPPDQGAYLHLLIDLYRRETQEIVRSYEKRQALSGFITLELATRLEQEAALTQMIMESLNLSSFSVFTDRSLARECPSVESFMRARTRIAECLEQISTEQADFQMKIGTENTTIGQFVQALVFDPSQYAIRIQAIKRST